MLKKKYIAIDLRAWDWAGIGRYSRCLLSELLVREDNFDYIALAGSQDKIKIAKYFKRFIESGRLKMIAIEGSYYTWKEQVLLPRQLEKVPADLWHFTHFNVPAVFNRPYVVTIHDVTRLIFPGQTQKSLGRQMVYEWVFKRSVKRAKLVFCVSQTTAKELGLILGELPPLMVTPEGVEQRYLAEIAAQERQKAQMLTGGKEPYALYVGVWMGHKNLKRIMSAYARARMHVPDLKLVMTGRRKRGYEDVPRLAEAAGLDSDDVRYLGFVPEELLPGLYAQAACLILPSLYEGFGLPVLEAMAIGCPIISANSSNIPELTAGNGWLVNPEDEEQIALALGAAARGEYPADLRVAARKQAEKYSWKRCAEETVEGYKRVLE